MRPVARLLYLAFGLALLAVVLRETPLAAVAERIAHLGATGLAAVVGIYWLAFLADSISWVLTIAPVPVTPRWIARAFLVRMAGEAFNHLLPAAGFGGEPLKAVVLERRYGIGVRDSVASIVLARTVAMIALIGFLVVGFAMTSAAAALPRPVQQLAALGLAALTAGTVLFFGIQRLRLTSRAGHRLSRLRAGRRLAKVLHLARDLDARFVHFYTEHRARLLGATALAFANWVLGVVEIYVASRFLGHPLGWETAWILEAMAQMVRTAVFFIPGALGAQEGVFVLLCGALAGSAPLGLALAVVRRARELIWVAAGMAVAWAITGGGPAALARPVRTPEP